MRPRFQKYVLHGTVAYAALSEALQKDKYEEAQMKNTRRVLIAALGILAATLLAPLGSAACVAASQARVKHTSLLLQPGVGLMPAAFFNDGDHDADDAAIVGYWHQKLISEPDGKVVDAALIQWHRDHTEIQNAITRAPSTGSICTGVWKQTGKRTFRLNHFALLWDATGTVFLGPANVREEVTVGPEGQHYRGSMTLDEYDPTGKTLLLHVQGIATGTRITVDSTPESVFSN